MTTSALTQFEGFVDLIQKPFERNDERSFLLIQKLLQSAGNSGRCGFCFLIEALSGITIGERDAKHHWKKILEHKRQLELKVGRTVNIKPVVIDYYDQLGISLDASAAAEKPPAPAPARESIVAEDRLVYQFIKSQEANPAAKSAEVVDMVFERLSTPGYHQKRFKEELMRSRRYKHALSAIMFDLNLQAISDASVTPETRDKALGIVVKMINKTIRTVDILTRYTVNHFLLILPNTNKREASELALRLKNNICERTAKIPGLAGGISITLAMGQCSKDDTAADFNKRLENLVEAGKKRGTNKVYTLE